MVLRLLVMMFLKTAFVGHCPEPATRWNLMILKHATVWKRKNTVIVKFKCRKQKRSILINRKNLRNKSDVLTELNASGRLFVSESMCHEKQQLSYKCRQWKNAGKINSTWFWNNSVNGELNERSQPRKIHHVIDIEKLLGAGNLDEFINNTSF